MDEENLYKAVALIKAGEKQEGGRLLKEILKKDPKNEYAWLWMSACVQKHEHIRYCLNKVLDINPNNQKARQVLSRLSSQTSVDRPSRKKRKPSKLFSPKKLLAYLAGGFIFVCCGFFGLMELLGLDNPTEEVGALPQQVDLGESPTSSPIPTLLIPTATLPPAATPTETPIPIPGSYSCVPQNTQRDQAELSRVIDGDTIEVKIDDQAYTVRYIGMDTPDNGESFFVESSEHNQQLLEGKTLVLVKDVSEIDQFDRLLRYVFAGDTFVNWHMIQDGYAQVATYPPDVACIEYFIEAETVARNTKIGLWGITPTSTSTSVPVILATPTPQSSNCHPSYPTVCIPPPPPDLNCGDIPFKDFTVVGSDPHNFDGNNDGVGCES